MFSYVDLVRLEIVMDAEERFGVMIGDEEPDIWRSLGDIARWVAVRASGPTTEAEVLGWVRTLLADEYSVAEEPGPEDDVFGSYDQVTEWFFARKRGNLPSAQDPEPGAAADPAS